MSETKYFGNLQRHKEMVIEGARFAASIISSSSGPYGSQIYHLPINGAISATKDGYNISKKLDIYDPFKKIGLKIIQELSDKMANLIGDGSTTITTIASELMEKVHQAEVSGIFPRDLSEGMSEVFEYTIKLLEDISYKISDKHDCKEYIKSVAKIASNGDAKISSYFEEAFEKIGTNGAIIVEESKNYNTSVEVISGVWIERGAASHRFFKEEERNKWKIEVQNPFVLICYGKITKDFIYANQKFLQENFVATGKKLVIVAGDFDTEIVDTFSINRISNVVEVVCVNLPSFGETQEELANDLSINLGGKVFEEKEDNNLNYCLGKCEKVIIEKDRTIFIDPLGDDIKIQERVDVIRNKINEATSPYHKEILEKRIASMKGSGICTIKVGGATNAEVEERKDRIDDAKYAVFSALKEGVVTGGGTDTMYLYSMLIKKAEEYKNNNQNVLSTCCNILGMALRQPFYLLMRSCGYQPEICEQKLLSTIKHHHRPEYGYDLRTKEFRNLFRNEEGKERILNAAAVPLEVLRILKGFIGPFINCRVFIADVLEEKKNNTIKNGFNLNSDLIS
ncbi:hypothetical protein AB836_00655 [Rickettsiales bacterium (ex Bugula neritina AB1)]|nr:hypothetical protein AB836_00655 [Rickettsiales bacterium (ex Bugula neritina AB1)]